MQMRIKREMRRKEGRKGGRKKRKERYDKKYNIFLSVYICLFTLQCNAYKTTDVLSPSRYRRLRDIPISPKWIPNF